MILSLGAFGSPQLLLLSGIGAEAALRAQALPVVQDLPVVGQNLQDHLDPVLSRRSLRSDVVGLNPAGLWRLLRAGLDGRRNGEGLFASPMAEAGAFVHSAPGLTRPDLQVHVVVGIVDDHLRRIHLADGYSSHICVLRPESQGTVGLTDANPLNAPRIDPAFLSDPRDLTTSMAAARLMQRVPVAEPLAPWRGQRLYPHDGIDTAWKADLRARADTIYHLAGTCRMGRDAMAVTAPICASTGCRVCVWLTPA